jgi:hypothetical protein
MFIVRFTLSLPVAPSPSQLEHYFFFPPLAILLSHSRRSPALPTQLPHLFPSSSAPRLPQPPDLTAAPSPNGTSLGESRGCTSRTPSGPSLSYHCVNTDLLLRCLKSHTLSGSSISSSSHSETWIRLTALDSTLLQGYVVFPSSSPLSHTPLPRHVTFLLFLPMLSGPKQNGSRLRPLDALVLGIYR